MLAIVRGKVVLKRALIVFLFFLCFIPLFANSQNYYPVSSTEWHMVNDICHSAGVIGPTSNGPVTASQLLLSLERAEKILGENNYFIVEMKKILSNKAVFEDDLGSLFLDLEVSPEAYWQKENPFSLPLYSSWDLDRDWFIKRHGERSSFLKVTFSSTVLDSVYGRFVFDFRQKFSTEENYWASKLHTSIFFENFMQNPPDNAGVSIGGKGVSLIAGRVKQSKGEGYSGNTAIGDNFDYQEVLKAGYYNRFSSIFFTLTSFDSSHDKELEKPWQVDSSTFSSFRQLRYLTDYEIALFDKIRFSFGFVTLLDTDSAFDIRFLNPFSVLHSLYNFHEHNLLEANNMIICDLSLSLAKGLYLYGQLSIDQIQLPGEVRSYYEDLGYVDPNSFGLLVNLSYSSLVNKGILNVYLEGVYNTPAMYLNTKFYRDDGSITLEKGVSSSYCWSQDYLVGYARNGEEGVDNMNYAGYIYGPDCFTLSLGSTYTSFDALSFSSSIFYMVHGEKGRGSNLENYTFIGIDGLDTYNDYSLTGIKEYTLSFKSVCSIKLFDSLTLSFGGAYTTWKNFRNVENSSFSNLQLFVGATISAFSLIDYFI